MSIESRQSNIRKNLRMLSLV
ncbi:hypothetical protein KM92DES2_11411 [uncultured Desulfovibrio sp.]|uniref:Uncharacterized protein n=1 Tax=uncultured Desulfovibrio sp. TaxID=167968 RepID=A0A212JN17_9BACT|nr:hypothetical protein KM92DES2_11411 [uncultured Desulfovibrio sp.]